MALPAYSTRFIGEDISSTSPPVVATVPAGFRWVIKQLTYVQVSGAPDGFIFFQAPGDSYVWSVNVGVDGARGIVNLDQVLESGESLTVTVTGPDYVFSVHVSGYQLFNNP